MAATAQEKAAFAALSPDEKAIVGRMMKAGRDPGLALRSVVDQRDAYEREQPSDGEQLGAKALGIADSMGGVLADEAAGVAGALVNAGTSKGLVGGYTEGRDRQRAKHQEAVDAAPGEYGSGELLGAVGQMAAMPVAGAKLLAKEAAPAMVAVPKALRYAKQVASGAVPGAIAGWGSGEGAMDSAKQAGIGALLGGGLGALGAAGGEYAASRGAKPPAIASQAPEASSTSRGGAGGVYERLKAKVADRGGAGQMTMEAAARKVPVFGNDLAESLRPPQSTPAGPASPSIADDYAAMLAEQMAEPMPAMGALKAKLAPEPAAAAPASAHEWMIDASQLRGDSPTPTVVRNKLAQISKDAAEVEPSTTDGVGGASGAEPAGNLNPTSAERGSMRRLQEKLAASGGADAPAPTSVMESPMLGKLRRESSVDGGKSGSRWNDTFDESELPQRMFDAQGNELPVMAKRAWQKAGERMAAPVEGGPASVAGMLDSDVAAIAARGRPTKGGLGGESQYHGRRNGILAGQTSDADLGTGVRESARGLLGKSRTASEELKQGAGASATAPGQPSIDDVAAQLAVLPQAQQQAMLNLMESTMGPEFADAVQLAVHRGKK